MKDRATSIAKVLAGRCKINYTRAAVSKGAIPEGVSAKTLTEPLGYVMEAKIAAVTNPVDGKCQVTVQINSSDVETGFYAMGIAPVINADNNLVTAHRIGWIMVMILPFKTIFLL